MSVFFGFGRKIIIVRIRSAWLFTRKALFTRTFTKQYKSAKQGQEVSQGIQDLHWKNKLTIHRAHRHHLLSFLLPDQLFKRNNSQKKNTPKKRGPKPKK